MSRISQLVAKAEDIPFEDVPVPDWGCTIRVKGMDGTQRSSYMGNLNEALAIEDPHEKAAALSQVECELIVHSSYDPEDESPCFTDDDIPMLATKSSAALLVLANKAATLSGLDGKAEERLGKGYLASVRTATPAPAIPSSASTSTSPGNSGE